jgi:general nucleoside transport system permease protein
MLISGGSPASWACPPCSGFSYRYTRLPDRVGFAGIAVALLGRNHPVGIVFGALLFGFMDRSAQILDLRGIPKEIVVIMQGVVVLRGRRL